MTDLLTSSPNGPTTMSLPPFASPDSSPAGPGRAPDTFVGRLLRASAYNLGAFPVALVGFVLAVTGVSAGLGTLVIGVGLVVLAATAYVVRGLAHVERLRMRSLLGRPAPSPTYAVARDGAGYWRRSLTPLRDPQSWLDLLWAVVGFVTGLLALVVTVTWWAGVAGGLTYWFWQQWLPADDVTLASLIGFGEGQGAESVLYLLIGLAMLLTLPVAVRLLATIHAGVAATLLCSRAELQGEVRRVTGGRDAARVAEAHSMRRLERDIHDGPQQRLVRLAMDLGRAKAQLGDDAGPAAATIDAALQQARDTLEELRALSRGIAPPLLVDRGLEVALRELVLRSTVPVGTRFELTRVLPPHVETAVYFVVSEALTNVNKHSGAGSAEVAVVVDGTGVVAVVHDDGTGGAHPAKGRGLAGLEQRLAAVDGRLTITSPDGGPTTLTAVIPTSPARGAR